jgi:hypothetical protein
MAAFIIAAHATPWQPGSSASTTDREYPLVRSKKNVAINYRNTTGHAPRRELNSGILNFPMIAHIDFSRSSR